LNREECLLRSLRANIRQTRPPKQVIVVDSSDGWEATKQRFFEEIAPEAPEIEWIYIGAAERSLTLQRNLGFARVTSDVVFFLDDDSFMYRDCAREIMGIYEADAAERIGGVCAQLASVPEGTPEPPSTPANSLFSLVRDTIISFWHQEELFIPYDGGYHKRPVPGLDPEVARPVALFHGCRMTFRSESVRAVGGFELALIRVAYGEDGDCSYRISRSQALVAAMRAKLFHEQTPVQRPKRSRNTSLILMNVVTLYRLNHPPSAARDLTVYGFLGKRTALEFLRDCARPQRGMPNVRGAFRAIRQVPGVLAQDRDTIRRTYRQLQTDFYERD
jgi:GT2 family glycosyltransferase